VFGVGLEGLPTVGKVGSSTVLSYLALAYSSHLGLQLRNPLGGAGVHGTRGSTATSRNSVEVLEAYKKPHHCGSWWLPLAWLKSW